jgi:membrane-bound metal-dependent hydrolase YbcI (DUF457 family)
MPFTPYHFGPSGFIGLAFRKWIDIPVFILANVIVDLEVLIIPMLGLSYPIHRYAHTLLLGTAAGIIWAVAAYRLRNLFKSLMHTLRIPYQPKFWKMLISGILGVWLHVVLDAIYHPDVRLFWPDKSRPLYRLITKQQLEALCLAFVLAAIILYIFAAIPSFTKNRAITKSDSKAEK